MDAVAYLTWTQNPLLEQMLTLGAWLATVGIVLAGLGYILLEGRSHD